MRINSSACLLFTFILSDLINHTSSYKVWVHPTLYLYHRYFICKRCKDFFYHITSAAFDIRLSSSVTVTVVWNIKGCWWDVIKKELRPLLNKKQRLCEYACVYVRARACLCVCACVLWNKLDEVLSFLEI